MHHRIDPLTGPYEAITVPHIADEVAYLGVVACREHLLHLKLFQLIPGIDDQTLHAGMVRKGHLHEFFPERAGAAGYQYGFSV
jgi:hypothetical protein